MTDYNGLLRVFVPRSPLLRVLGLGVLTLGAGLGPMLNATMPENQAWLPHYLAATMLAGVGFSLGQTLRMIRSWPTAAFIPGLVPAAIRLAIAMVTGLSGIYVAVLIATDSLNGLTPTLSLALGSLALLVSARLNPLASGLVLLSLLGFLVIDNSRTILLAVLNDPVTTWALFPLTFGAWLLLFVRYRDPSNAAVPMAAPLQMTDFTQTHYPHFAFLTDLDPASLANPLRSAFHHARQQTWFNEGVLVCSTVGLTGLAVLLLGGSTTEFARGTALLTGILVTTLPIMQRAQLSAMQDFLWLSGCCETRAEMAGQVFNQMLMPALRMSAVVVVLITLLSIASGTSTDTVAITSLLLAPASAAIMLTLILIFGSQLTKAQNGQMLFVCLGVVLLPGMMNFLAVILSTDLQPHFILLTALVTSLTIIALGKAITEKNGVRFI